MVAALVSGRNTPRVNVDRLSQGLNLPWPVSYGVGAGLFLIALFARFLIDGLLPTGYPYLTFFPAIILAAFLLGTGEGTLVAVLSLLGAWYFFIPPEGFSLTGSSAVALIFFAFVFTVDLWIIHVMKNALEARRIEQARSASLAATRDTMFQELQHRISNNLQLVSALMTLQSASVRDEQARDALSQASNRLILLAKIHRRLYDPEGDPIEPPAFFAEICDDVLQASGASHVACEVAVDPVRLAADRTIPLTLILMELVSNAIEHGFAASPRGSIRVELKEQEGSAIALNVQDDGAGLAPGFDLATTRSLGLRVVKALSEQLGGTFTMERATPGGTLCRLVIPA
jgi:two-component system, sensor histidine kinase PdtaS